MSRSRNPPVRGQGAARAKQMGLLLDLNPDGGMDAEGNDAELEAELLSLMGGSRSAGKKAGGRAPVPMVDIEHMAALCMKDLDEEDGDEDGDLESDADLLAELNEVLEGDEEEEAAPLPQQKAAPHHTPVASPGPQNLEALLAERIGMYQAAISNAKESGEGSKVRRYDRGLKTLQSMLASVKKGKPIDEAEIPPAVATGGKPAPAPLSKPDTEQRPRVLEPAPAPPTSQKPVQETLPKPPPKPQLLPPPVKTLAVTPDTPLISPLTPSQPDSHVSEVKRLVSGRQREYKLAAIQAKQSGDTDLAKRHYLAAKKLDPLIEALDRGETVDVASLPPPPGNAPSPAPPPQSSSQPSSQPTTASPVAPPVSDTGLNPQHVRACWPLNMSPPHPRPPPVMPTALPAPRTVAEALQQRMERYKAAAEGAKTKGDDRKARMHQRIVKQYQDAIRANKAGRPVNLSELPTPPGCPPLQGSEGSEQNLVGVLETAMKLANQDADAEDDDESGTGEPAAKPTQKAAVQRAKAPVPPAPESVPPGSASTPGQAPRLGAKAQQQLDFLLMRRQQFVRAAVRSKQMKDLQGAALHLRNAKGLDHMITAAKGGLPVDITKVPSVPVSEEDYSLGQTHSQLSPRSSEKYGQLMELLRQQHEKCMGYSQQFTNMGNIAETTRFEKLAEECMKNIEVLKKAYEKSCPVPKFHTEERTFNIVKIFPDLTSNDLMLTIVKGTNLPSGGSANDLDASVRFEFPFPSSEDPQHDKTSTVKNSNCPEFKEQFKLNISRSHRSFKRVVQTKGIKFEIIHKGGLFKADRVVGNAQLKLDSLETQCEIRQLLEVLDGRKATGGRLEVRVKIREPLGGPQLQTVTEKWLVLDPIATPPAAAPAPKSKPRPQNDHDKKASRSPPQYKFHSFSLLQYDKDRVEHKIMECKKNRVGLPPELLQQHRDISQRLQWQKSHLERAPPAVFAEYDAALCRLAQGLGEGVKKYSSQGNRDAAKDALGRLKMVEAEIEALRKRCAT